MCIGRDEGWILTLCIGSASCIGRDRYLPCALGGVDTHIVHWEGWIGRDGYTRCALDWEGPCALRGGHTLCIGRGGHTLCIERGGHMVCIERDGHTMCIGRGGHTLCIGEGWTHVVH